MTLMSGKVYSDSGTPSNAIGEQGDIFMQLDGLKTTYRKEGGAWAAIGNQLGTIPEFLKGLGVPSNVLGQDNQYYREVNTDTIYEKQSGVWKNIASWTSLEIQQLLLSNGIGADLAVANHVSNVDTFIEAGAEGYFDNTTTGTTPDVYGLVKVWRESEDIVYQKAQVAGNSKWATRYTSASGDFTGIAWRVTANEDGDAGRRFKALAGVAADDVAVMSQLPVPPAIPISTVAAAIFDGTDASIFSQYGIASITRNGVGSYTINLNTVFSDTNYIVLAQANGFIGDPFNVADTVGVAVATQKFLSSFKLVVGDNDTDINIDVGEVSFVVFKL